MNNDITIALDTDALAREVVADQRRALRNPYLSPLHPWNAAAGREEGNRNVRATTQAAVADVDADYTLTREALKEALAKLDAQTAKVAALQEEVRDSQDEALKVRQERDAGFDAVDFTPCDTCQLDGTPTLCDACWPRYGEEISRVVKQRRNRRRIDASGL